MSKGRTTSKKLSSFFTPKWFIGEGYITLSIPFNNSTGERKFSFIKLYLENDEVKNEPIKCEAVYKENNELEIIARMDDPSGIGEPAPEVSSDVH